MTATKRCRKRGINKPATAKYFYRNKQNEDGLADDCKDCIKEYQKGYYSGRRRKEPEKPKIGILTGESKEKILKNYKVGQVVNIRYRGPKEGSKEYELKKAKIKILGFYPNLVLCLKDNCKECYNYQELDQLTTY